VAVIVPVHRYLDAPLPHPPSTFEQQRETIDYKSKRDKKEKQKKMKN
jgi:hypothetical protein